MGTLSETAGSRSVVPAILIALSFALPSCHQAPPVPEATVEDADGLTAFIRDANVTEGVADEAILEIMVKRRTLPARGYFSPLERKIVLRRGHSASTRFHELGHAAWLFLFDLPDYSGPGRPAFRDVLCAKQAFAEETRRQQDLLRDEMLLELLDVCEEDAVTLELICRGYLARPHSEYITFACARLGRDADQETRRALRLALDEIFAEAFAEWMGGAPDPLLDQMRYRGMRLRSPDRPR
jgi:hypothetical protein